jgi:hypothetical protein
MNILLCKSKMKLVPTKNYKKLYKTLNKKTASIPITINMNNTNYYDCLDCEHVEITESFVISTTKLVFPNDIINYILEFIPINMRLSILKSKYNKKFLKNKLEKINVENLYKCALLADEINNTTYSHLYLYKVLSIENNLSKEEINKYPYYYKEKFITMILSAIKHHCKIYKKKKITYSRPQISIGTDHHGMKIYIFIIKKTNVYKKYEDIPKFEKMLLKMYSQLILI